MPYFAFARPADGKPLSIRHCHANLWMLPGIPSTKTFFDVGVHIRADNDDLKKLSVALPFVSDECIDLSSTLRDATTSQLIFRQQSRDGKVSFRDVVGLRVVSLDSGNTKRLPTDRDDRSLWDIALADTLAKDEERYARFRFVIKRCARAWNGKRHVLMNYGGLLDFRIADTREIRGDADWDSVRDRILPIESIQFFLVAALELQLRQSSPSVYSTRVLEPNAWEKYLRRTTLGRRMVIYGWEYPPASTTPPAAPSLPINEERPYRIFADFSREATSLALPTALQNVLLILILGVLGWFAWRWLQAFFGPQDLFSRLATYALSLTVVGAVTAIVTRLPMIRKALGVIGQALSWLDLLVYQRRR